MLLRVRERPKSPPVDQPRDRYANIGLQKNKFAARRVCDESWPAVTVCRVRIGLPRFVDLEHMSIGVDH
jgi:hypothetical protein